MIIILWGVVGILLLVGLAVGIMIWRFQREVNTENPLYLLEFMKKHKGDPNVSLYIRYNNQPLLVINESKKLPLASTVKLIIAIEYAQQAAEGRIDPDQLVSLEELNTFYLPGTDGGAHQAWMERVKSQGGGDSVPLSEVAYGMIGFSSNANTDYLIHVLGLDRINQQLERLGLEDHDLLYPIVSSMFIPVYLSENRNLSRKEVFALFKNMEMSEYRKLALEIHRNWLNEPLTKEDKKKLGKFLSMDFQRIWSDRLPRASTATYISILDKINYKTYFGQDVHKYLDPVLEQLMENPHNQQWLVHAGQKGGSTAFILTKAMYATDKQGNKTEFAFFTTNLEPLEAAKLTRNLNEFQLKVLTEDHFREGLIKELSE